jgi:hypothetical protein
VPLILQTSLPQNELNTTNRIHYKLFSCLLYTGTWMEICNGNTIHFNSKIEISYSSLTGWFAVPVLGSVCGRCSRFETSQSSTSEQMRGWVYYKYLNVPSDQQSLSNLFIFWQQTGKIWYITSVSVNLLQVQLIEGVSGYGCVSFLFISEPGKVDDRVRSLRSHHAGW